MQDSSLGIFAARQKVISLTQKMESLFARAKSESRDLNAAEEQEWNQLKTQRAHAQANVAEIEARLDLQRHIKPEAIISGDGMGSWKLLGEDIPAGVMPIPGRKRTYESIFGPVVD